MLKILFWVVVLVLALSYFGISVQALLEAPATHQNFTYIWQSLADWFQSGWIGQAVADAWSKLLALLHLS